MTIMVTSLSSVQAFAVGTDSFSDQNFRETVLIPGQKFTIEYPNRLFVTMMSQKGEGSGDFSLEYQYLMGDMHHGGPNSFEMPDSYRKSTYFLTFFIAMNNGENTLIIILSFASLICLIAVCGGLVFAFRHKLGAYQPDDFELSRMENAKLKTTDPVAMPYFGNAAQNAAAYQ